MQKSTRRWLNIGLKSLFGLAAGIILAYGLESLMSLGLVTLRDYMPILMATLFALLAVTVWINPYVRRIRAPGEPLLPRCLTALTFALGLAAPAVIPPYVNPIVVLALVAALYGTSWLLARIVSRRFDELARRVIADTNQFVMNLVVPIVALYGAAERLKLVPEGMSVWILNGILIWLYFMVSQFAWMRRGVDNPFVAEE